MINVEKILKENKSLDGYRINTSKTTSYENFYVKGKLETVRATETEDVNATVYTSHDGKTGVSSFNVPHSMDEKGLRTAAEKAAHRANLVFNEKFPLSEAGEVSREIHSDVKNYAPEVLSEKIADAVFSCETGEEGRINALEIFIYKHENSVVNSNGVNKSETKYSVMVEAIPTWNENDESVELYEAIHFTSFDEDKLKAEIAEKMREVRDRKHAVLPDEKKFDFILFRKKEIAELLDNLAGDFNYRTVYSRSNVFKKGDLLQNNPTGDKLTITMQAEADGCRYSALFDADGVTLKDKTVVKDGKVVSYYGGNRFGSYLKEEITGELSCIVVEKGSLTDSDLSGKKYLECVSLSGLQVDLFNDYIGGEIRLAYMHKGDEVVPVTGIAFSGKLSDALSTMRLSASVDVEENYVGPDMMTVEKMNVV